MSYEIVLSSQAIEDIRRFRANDRATLKEALETHLRHAPQMESRSRIKRLRGMARPQYRLRVDDFRVFYDITGDMVEILAIVAKPDAETWLAQFGEPEKPEEGEDDEKSTPE